MSINRDEVQKVAHLARLAVNDATIPQYAQELSKILDLIAQMDKVDTDNVQPMAHPLHISQPLRADEVTETNQREQLQKLAPAVECSLYLVPQVIE